MKAFMDENFLLSTDTARELYHTYAKDMPIYDYHCHLNPKEILDNIKYRNISHLMLGGDHYKWRAMLSNGADDSLMYGDQGEAGDWEKFYAYASMLKYAIGNPLYHWTHLELQRVFGIYDVLNEKTAKSIYDRAALEIGDVPIVVANDGDVTALAGAMGMECNSVMGMAMGTSEAVGYVDGEGNVLGWLNELAFAPVDLLETAMADEWSTDIGVGCKYFSQDAVIKLAPRAGIELDEALTPAEKLKAVQNLVEKGDERAKRVFESIGAYLAHTMRLYCRFYDVKHLMVLGRVMSGVGGNIVLDTCLKILADEYPEMAKNVRVMLPDEKTRRVGQSVAAASLPEAKK